MKRKFYLTRCTQLILLSFYWDNMAFGKRTDDVIGSTPNKPKLAKYIVMDNISDNRLSKEERYIKRLNNKKDDLFDNFENDEDIHFLSFEGGDFIPIEESLNKIYDLFLDSTNQVAVQISIKHQEKIDYLFSPITISNLRNCLSKLDKLNLYLTIGFLEYQSYKAPLFFIPINLSGSFINRDYNRDIKFNYFLKAEIESESEIKFPNFNGSIEGYFHDLKKIIGFKISNKSFIGNFYFRKLLIYNDLSWDNWNYISEKVDYFFNNDYKFSIEDFKTLNDNIAKKWAGLDLNYTKDFKMKGADKLIINLLSQGNSILYISNYYSKREVKESLEDLQLNSLILDFDYDLNKYDIFNNFDKNLLQINRSENTSNLVENKAFNENLVKVLSKNYSNINLTPFEIQQKVDEFSNYKYDISMGGIGNISLEELNQFNNDIDFILDNFDLINSITNLSDEINFSNEDYEAFCEIINSIQNNIHNFEQINKELNENYGIKIFKDLNSPQYIENFDALNENSKYIMEEDYDKLNEFIKITFKYDNLEKNGNKLVSNKINNYTNNILNQKSKLEKFNDKIDEINSLVEYLDISDSEFNDYVKYISLLRKHPTLIDDEEKLSNVVNLIEQYSQKKNYNGSLKGILKKFVVENEVIKDILNEFEFYLSENNEKLILYKNIKEFYSILESSGFNFKSLNEYLDIKNKLKLFGNANYMYNRNFFTFNDYLKRFIDDYDDSIKNYFYQQYRKLKVILEGINENMANRYSISYKKDLFYNIDKILKIQSDLSLNFNNFEKLLENKEFIAYLGTKPVFDSNFTDSNLVNNFEKINNLNIETNIKEYVDSKIEEYANIVISINNLAEDYLKNNYDSWYIRKNILKIIEIKNQLGLSFNSLDDFMNNIDIFDILVQKPQFNYDIEEYQLYLDINKLFQEYKINDFDELLNYLNNKSKNYQKSITKKYIPFDGLTTSGSLTRGITIGNNQNSVL